MKKGKNRALSVLCIILCLTMLLPVELSNYVTASAEEKTINTVMDFTKTASSGSWSASADLDTDGYSYNEATLTLALKNVKLEQRIRVKSDTKIEIYGTVTFADGAGIYGSSDVAIAGNLTITGNGENPKLTCPTIMIDKDLSISDLTYVGGVNNGNTGNKGVFTMSNSIVELTYFQWTAFDYDNVTGDPVPSKAVNVTDGTTLTLTNMVFIADLTIDDTSKVILKTQIQHYDNSLFTNLQNRIPEGWEWQAGKLLKKVDGAEMVEPSAENPVSLQRQCTVTFDCNGGKATINGDKVESWTVKVPFGERVTEPTYTIERAGNWLQGGWCKDGGGGIEYDFSSDVEDDIILRMWWDIDTAAPASTDNPDAPVVTEAPTPTPVVTQEPTPTPVVTQEPTPTPVVTQEPTPTPVVTEAPTPTADDKETKGDKLEKTEMALLLLETSSSKGKIGLRWKKEKGAAGYEIYWSRCDGERHFKLLKRTKKTLHKHLKRDNTEEYKYIVAAYKKVKGKKVYIAKSATAHVALPGSKITNARSIKATKRRYSLKTGQKCKIKTTIKLYNKKKEPVLHVDEKRYVTSDKKVAKVSSDGTITAVGKGECTITVLTNNVRYVQVKVTVKE